MTGEVKWRQLVNVNSHFANVLDQAITTYPPQRFTNAKLMKQALSVIVRPTIPVMPIQPPVTPIPPSDKQGLFSKIVLGIFGITIAIVGVAFAFNQSESVSNSNTPQPSRGMWVLSVSSGSEAQSAGIRAGQILISLNGTYIDQVETANWIVSQNVNQTVTALVWDNGEQKSLTVVPTDNYIGVNLCQLNLCPNGTEP